MSDLPWMLVYGEWVGWGVLVSFGLAIAWLQDRRPRKAARRHQRAEAAIDVVQPRSGQGEIEDSSASWKLSGDAERLRPKVVNKPNATPPQRIIRAAVVGTVSSLMFTGVIGAVLSPSDDSQSITTMDQIAAAVPFARDGVLETIANRTQQDDYTRAQFDRQISLRRLAGDCEFAASLAALYTHWDLTLEIAADCESDTAGAMLTAYVGQARFGEASELLARVPRARSRASVHIGVVDIHLAAQRPDRAIEHLSRRKREATLEAIDHDSPVRRFRIRAARDVALATCLIGALEGDAVGRGRHGIELAKRSATQALASFSEHTNQMPATDLYGQSTAEVIAGSRAHVETVCRIASAVLADEGERLALLPARDDRYSGRLVALLRFAAGDDAVVETLDTRLETTEFIWRRRDVTPLSLLREAEERFSQIREPTVYMIGFGMWLEHELASHAEIAGDALKARRHAERAAAGFWSLLQHRQSSRHLELTAGAFLQRALFARRDGEEVLAASLYRELLLEAAAIRRKKYLGPSTHGEVSANDLARLREDHSALFASNSTRLLDLLEKADLPVGNDVEHMASYADSDLFLARREWAALNGETAMKQRYDELLSRWMEMRDNRVFTVVSELLPATLQR